MLSPGTKVGAYEIVASLGAGGMGEVYRAHDPRLGRDVALKVLPADMADDPARLERFSREARAIAALNHPHIVTIYSTEEAGGIRFLTMELVEGQALDSLIPPGGLPLPRFLEIALPLADALTAAHQKQITHRDLKPANVMVAADGRVKVLDFGLARVGGGGHAGHQTIEATRPVLTSEGTIVGTMPYMSPEQIDGKTLDHRTDLFSLGVMLHEMLVGSRPFVGESSPQLMSSILRDTPASATEIRPDVPESLSRLIHRCLEKRADDRMQTARDVYNELRHVQKQIESGARRRPDSGSGQAAAADLLWIAVLPFTTRGADPDAVALADGLTEDVTAGLARFPSLSVVATQSSLSFKSSSLDVRQIAERLNASFIIGGSVRRSAAGTRVTAHLIDARSGGQLWTETYDRDTESDVYAVQDDVTDRVVSTVADKNGVLVRSMVQAVRRVRLEEATSRQLVLRCWGMESHPTPAEHAELRAALEASVVATPDDADIWAELSHLYCAEYWLGFNPLPDSLPRAQRAARRAIELNPGHQQGWQRLAMAAGCLHDEHELTEASERAIALNPRNANTLARIGLVLTSSGDYERGGDLTERAMALNPSHPGWYHFALFNRHMARGEFTEALKAARRVNVPDLARMHFAIAAAAGHLGLARDGAAAVQAMVTRMPELADEASLLEFVERWYWDEALIASLLDGVRRSKVSIAEAPTARSQVVAAGAPSRSSGQSTMLARATTAAGTGIAVQLFTSRGDDKATAFAAALTDDITTGLSRFSHIRVVSRTSEGTPASARFVLEGSVRREKSALRVSARVIDTSSGAHLWAETYDQPAASGIRTRLGDRMRARGIVADTKAPGPPPKDVAAQIIATVADVYGVLFRSMSQGLKERPLESLSAGDVLLRYWSYQRQPEVAEHALLRERLEQLVGTQPYLADAWAALGDLYYQEFAHGFNPLADSLARAHRTVGRALDLDAAHHHAWHVRAVTCYFDRDRDGFEHAAERALALNPHNTNTIAFLAFLFSQLGETDRACEMTERAMALNAAHPGWYHFVFFDRHYMRGEFAEALAQARKINMPQNLWSPWAVAICAGQLGRASDAKTALDALFALAPAFQHEDVLREVNLRWRWNQPANVDLAMDGFRKAKALTVSGMTAPDLAGKPPVRSPDSAAGLVADAFIVTVIPFAAPATGGDAAELADGLTQGTAVGLSRFSYLRVVTRHVAVDSVTTGYVLQGSVRMAGGVVRVVTQLTDAASGQSLWAETYDRKLGGASLFDLQDELIEKIVATIADVSGALVRAMAAVVRHKPADALTPYEAVLRTLAYVSLMSPEEHATLRQALEGAVERAPNYADAWAALAFIYSEEHAQNFNVRPQAFERVRAATRRALELDSANQLAYFTLCRSAFFSRDLSAVRAAADRLIALNPLATHVLSFIGTATAYSGDWEAGLAYCARAMALNPNHAGIYHMPSVIDHYRRRDYQGALTILDRVNMPGYPNAMLMRAAVYAQLGRLDDALAVWREVEARVPGYNAADRAHTDLAKWFQPELVAHIEEAVDKIRRHGARQNLPASSPGLATGPSIAVLPFDDLSPGKDQDWFCEGISEEILNALSQLSGLRVAARASAFSFRNRGDDLQAIAGKLGVATVLQGSVRRAGDRVRVTVQLVDAGNGFQLWSERYDRELKDIFDVQDEIARAIAERLKVSLSLGANERLVSRVTTNLEAYELLLTGRMFLTRRGRAILDALPCFERAIALDPKLAEAHALLGDSYRLLGLYGMAPAIEVMPKARASLERALALDPTNVEALATLSNIAAVYDWNVSDAIVIAERALASDPNHVRTLAERSVILTRVEGLPAEIVEGNLTHVRRARELDPLNAWAAAIEAYCLSLTGREEEAAAKSHDAVALAADNFTARWVQVWTLSAAGRLDEALAAAGPALAMSGRNARVLTDVAAIYAARGDRAGAEAIYQELRTRAETTYIPYAEQCAAAASAGRLDEARTLLVSAIDAREPSLGFWKLPAWTPFRNFAEGMRLLRATGLMSIR